MIIEKKKELLTYSQEYISKYNHDTENTQMVFNYILFPQLDFSIYSILILLIIIM